MHFIDSHCHLTDTRYENVQTIIDACNASDVKTLVDVGWNTESTIKAAKNAEKFACVYFSAGIHPSESLKTSDEDIKVVESFLSSPKCVAAGEIGLDYHYDDTDKKSQQQLFEAQLYLADKYKLPVIIHSRDASSDMLDILSRNKNLLQNGFLMHCYSESKEQAKNYLDLGGYFAFGGVITFKNAKKDEIVKSVPKDRILAETDAPYMSPEPFRGRVNYPENVVLVYKKLAAIYGEDEESLTDIIYENFKRFLKKVSL